jgi:hypothetical protein
MFAGLLGAAVGVALSADSGHLLAAQVAGDGCGQLRELALAEVLD